MQDIGTGLNQVLFFSTNLTEKNKLFAKKKSAKEKNLFDVSSDYKLDLYFLEELLFW